MKKIIIGMLVFGSFCSFAAEKYSKVSECKVLKSDVSKITLYKNFKLSDDEGPSLILFKLKNGDSKIYSANVELTGSHTPILKVSAEIIDFSSAEDLAVNIDHTKGGVNGKLSVKNKELNLKCKINKP